MKKLFRKLFEFAAPQKKKNQPREIVSGDRGHRHEIPSKKISDRFGRAIERLADK